jgi:hypothetical protein
VYAEAAQQGDLLRIWNVSDPILLPDYALREVNQSYHKTRQIQITLMHLIMHR